LNKESSAGCFQSTLKHGTGKSGYIFLF